MMRSYVLLVLLLPSVLCGLADAQYMYLDSNGDGLSTSADTLHSSGPTTLTIYLNTNHDRDGSVQSCNSHTGAPSAGGPINLFSYAIVLRASGGTVEWGSFLSLNPAFTALGSDLTDDHDTEFTRARPPGTTTAAGLIALGTISVTVTSGSPGIQIGTSTPLHPGGLGTAFGTVCEGSESGNSYILGTDWFDVDGVLPPPGGSEMATVNDGELFMGGNRISAPYTLTTKDEVLTINGYTLPSSPPTVGPTPTATDSAIHALNISAGRVMSRIAKSGKSQDEILSATRDVYATSPLVRSAVINRGVVDVTFIDGSKMGMPLPLAGSSAPMPTASQKAAARLKRVRDALSRGGAVFLLDAGQEYFVPRPYLSQLHDAIDRAKKGQTLTETQRLLLPSVLEEQIKTPLILRRVP